MYRTHRRPLGQPTRGKTAPGRLRGLDNLLCALSPGLLRAPGPAIFLDVGFGETPATTLESASRLARINPALGFVGVEIDRARVEAAQPFASERLRFIPGGFDADPGAPARVIRAMNVLRQYGEEAVAPAWAEMGRRLIEGGVMFEGTSDPMGRRLAVNVLEKRQGALCWEGVVFFTRLKGLFDPAEFQPILPKNLIHRVTPGEPVEALFSAWEASWRECQGFRPFGPRALFRETRRALSRRVSLDPRPWLARHGYVWWRP